MRYMAGPKASTAAVNMIPNMAAMTSEQSASACARSRSPAPSARLTAPDTVPPTTVPAPAPASAQAVIQIIREEWPDHLEEKALQIAWRESNYKPRVVGGTRNCCWGLFQIFYEVHKGWLPTVGVNAPEDLLDARLNARAAYRIYQRSGSWRPWGG